MSKFHWGFKYFSHLNMCQLQVYVAYSLKAILLSDKSGLVQKHLNLQCKKKKSQPLSCTNKYKSVNLVSNWVKKLIDWVFICQQPINVTGPYQCYYMSLSLVNISLIVYINHTHFTRNSFIYEISVCLHFVNIQQMLHKVPENVSQHC